MASPYPGDDQEGAAIENCSSDPSLVLPCLNAFCVSRLLRSTLLAAGAGCLKILMVISHKGSSPKGVPCRDVSGLFKDDRAVNEIASVIILRNVQIAISHTCISILPASMGGNHGNTLAHCGHVLTLHCCSGPPCVCSQALAIFQGSAEGGTLGVRC